MAFSHSAIWDLSIKILHKNFLHSLSISSPIKLEKLYPKSQIKNIIFPCGGNPGKLASTFCPQKGVIMSEFIESSNFSCNFN